MCRGARGSRGSRGFSTLTSRFSNEHNYLQTHAIVYDDDVKD